MRFVIVLVLVLATTAMGNEDGFNRTEASTFLGNHYQ
jgi:hypothetical protein